ncbi:hypothetical protein T492DRAFT_1150034 [Pavlovales sp. CCMP2436]|nr:hypothetical protein T492DRAFT_1150034 [Pavlovales sp. CCMP2436]
MAPPPVRLAGKFRSMELHVEAPGLRPLLVTAERSDTVAELKRRVHAQLGRAGQRTPAPALRLRLAPAAAAGAASSGAGAGPSATAPGRWLDDRRTLGTSGVRPGATLELVIPVKLSVRPLGGGPEAELWADRFAPLADLRAQLERRADARAPPGAARLPPPPRLPLAHDGRPLSDARTLGNYRLGHGAKLSAVVAAPRDSPFCAARAALAECVACACSALEDAAVRQTPPLQPAKSTAEHAALAANFGATAAAEQARSFAAAHAALGEALVGLAAVRRGDDELRAELAALADADVDAAAELRGAMARARELLGAARAGLGALERLEAERPADD